MVALHSSSVASNSLSLTCSMLSLGLKSSTALEPRFDEYWKKGASWRGGSFLHRHSSGSNFSDLTVSMHQIRCMKAPCRFVTMFLTSLVVVTTLTLRKFILVMSLGCLSLIVNRPRFLCWKVVPSCGVVSWYIMSTMPSCSMATHLCYLQAWSPCRDHVFGIEFSIFECVSVEIGCPTCEASSSFPRHLYEVVSHKSATVLRPFLVHAHPKA